MLNNTFLKTPEYMPLSNCRSSEEFIVRRYNSRFRVKLNKMKRSYMVGKTSFRFTKYLYTQSTTTRFHFAFDSKYKTSSVDALWFI